jgi:subtilisin family serine protease
MRLLWRAIFRFVALIILYLGCMLSSRAADRPESVPGRLLAGYRGDPASPALALTLLLHHAVVRRHVAPLGLHVLEVPEAASEAIAASLRRSGLFDYVERDYYGHTGSDPNDPSYIAQWHLPKIAGPQAWAVTTGSGAVTVAVVDSGVYAQHPDLAGKLLPGWNFVQSNSDTSDVLGHGTAVAGTLAAATNNGIGIAGVNWASHVMPLVVVDENDFAAYSDIASAIQYAADHGVRIINISIGGSSPSSTLQAAVDYAWSRGAVVFASAMNDSSSAPYYPAACGHVVAVSATDANDHLASFSNYGSWITLAAPGTNILSTMNGGGYGYWNGTSFSSPIAAGVGALLLAVNPQMTNATLVMLLQQSADSVGDPIYFGAGRVNAYRAILAAQPPAPQKRPRAPFTLERRGQIR